MTNIETNTNAHTKTDTSLSISKLNNQDLETRLHGLIHQERKLLHLILLHIKEVESRKLYLKKAYPSLFEYLTKEYGYSAGSAMRRIEAARLLRDVPQMALKIQTGDINLSQITEISRAVKEKQRETKTFVSRQEKEHLVLKVAGLNRAETQKVVSLELNIKSKEFEKKRTQKDESVRLELTLSKEQMQKLNQCKNLVAHILEQKKMDSTTASVIEVLMDQFLAKRGGNKGSVSKMEVKDNHDISKVEIKDNSVTSKMEIITTENVIVESAANEMDKENRMNAANKESAVKKENNVNRINLNKEQLVKNGNKTLTPKTKSQIYQRDQCCQYTDPKTNKKCKSTYKLEVDHRKSKWAGGGHQLSNLHVLCKNHNNLKYRVQSGRNSIDTA